VFVDRVEIKVSSGRGGAGCVSFHREKFIIQGGPDGGDGGRGGDVYFVIDNNTDTLSHFKGKRILKADNGKDGMGRKKYGKKGESLYIKVPPGTVIVDKERGETLLDLTDQEGEVLFLKGGKGGLGNTHFKSSVNQKPTYAQPGLEGDKKEIILELKLIADVGLVGYPNVGKSTLISTISNARPEIANYEFTTLTPKLGVVDVGEYSSFLMADIPGIIDGASDGKGLGLEFLKHIERTKTLLFLIDIANYRDIIEQYKNLKLELEKYSDELSKRAFAIVLTKSDLLDEESKKEQLDRFFDYLKLEVSNKNRYKFDGDTFVQELQEFENEFDKELPFFVTTISSAINHNLDSLRAAIYDLVKKM